jgi:hypothetical protein
MVVLRLLDNRYVVSYGWNIANSNTKFCILL